ncbi:MAG: GntR family transcriptional regulator [Lentisphaeria bacterium]|nr:MAG: GntR family transcriptional regulator [Lentisphaeria bacterium]
MVEGSVRGGKTDGGRARLREAIRDGRFLAGTYLPSARDLARQLGISKSSVHNILKLLQEEGLIQIYPGCGALVLENAEARRKFHRIFVRPSDFGTFRYLPVTAELLQGVAAGAEKQNVELLLSLTDSGRITDEMIAHHMAGTIQGVIYLQCANYPELIVPLEKAKIPCVIAADSMNHTEAVRTFIDFRATAREAVRHLVRRGAPADRHSDRLGEAVSLLGNAGGIPRCARRGESAFRSAVVPLPAGI